MQGIDLGSSNIPAVSMPKVALPVANGVTSTEAGNVWHLLDTHLNHPLRKLDVASIPA